MTERDDHQLLAEFARANSEAAFAALVQRHLGLVYSTALRSVGSTHAAEEVSQAVFIILAQKAGKLPTRIVLSGWLYQTTRLTAANFLRGEIRRQKREQEAYMQSTLNEPDSDAWPQIAPLLDEALDKLGGADRNAIVLRFLENKSLAEVGLALGASEDAAKMRVTRALEKLRKLFGKRGVALSATLIAGAVSASSIQAAPIGLAATISTVALTKGAAAGGSTLALVKGALKIMAWTKAKTAVAITVGALFAAGTATVVVETMLPTREPSYNGRSLTEWLGDAMGNIYSAKEPKQTAAEDAIRHMGKSTLPFLLNDLTLDPKLRRHRIQTLRPDNRTTDQRSSQAVCGFETLGPLAKSAIPELVRLLEQNPGYVPIALAGIGRDALPQIKQALTNRDFFVRDNMAAGLANAVYAKRIAPAEVEDVIPLAATNLAYTNPNTLFEVNTRWRAAGLIKAIQLDPDISVPALLSGLQDSHVTVATECAETLACFGSEARAATSALIKTVASTNSQLSSAACSALSFIDPDALVQNVFPMTMALATNTNPAIRMQTVQTLGRIGPKAREAVPALIAGLNDSDEVVRMVSAQSLGMVGQHSEQAVPALTRALQDLSQAVRIESINALGKFGLGARDAVTALLETAKADASLKGNVRIALESIDPNIAKTLR